MAVKLAQEHHIPRCVELLIGERPPNMAGDSPQFSGMVGYPDDPVAAAFEHLAKNGLPRPAPAGPARRRAVAGTGEAPRAKGPIDPDQALTYLHRGCSLASLAVKQIDLAVAVLSSFLDPEEVASLSDFTERVTTSHASLRYLHYSFSAIRSDVYLAEFCTNQSIPLTSIQFILLASL
jgi:hypothetical protein